MKVKPKSKEDLLKFVETIKQHWNDWRETKTASGTIEVEGKSVILTKVKIEILNLECM